MNRHSPRSSGDVAGFVDEQILGLLVTHDAEGYVSTPLPLLPDLGPDGEVRAIIGHFARANPHAARVARTPRALISFLGPHGYVAPQGISKPGWAPTWNYQLVDFEVEIELRPKANDIAIRMLVDRMEAGKSRPWTVARMGERYGRLLPQVVAFRAHVLGQRARFKLGQDEDETTFAEILDN